MVKSHTQVKALVLMFIFLLGVTAFERANTISYYLDNERNTANIFNPVATFLGISPNDGYGSDENSLYISGRGKGSNNNEENMQSDSIPRNSPSPTGVTNTNVPRAAGLRGDAGVIGKSIHGNTPTLLCLPGVLNKNEEAIVMWSCRDGAYKATASLFDTGDKTIGSARVAPSDDTTYALTCINNLAGIENTTSECAVNVANPALAIIATPAVASQNATTILSWKAKEVSSCIVTSEQYPSFERRGIEGEAFSPPLTTNSIFTLTCETVTGSVQERRVEVSLR
ncbi:hypothetical protein CL652_00495 [bacterium]|nr:hypothetical protein [bacterium]